jgi:predicted RNase H-like nuclease (RuvC/YqgF family)
MINLIGILILLGVEALIIYAIFIYQKEKYELEISMREKSIRELMQKIKEKNQKIKELQDESKRKDNQRLRKNY